MVALAGLLLAPQALAQSTPPPATYYQFDERGVDVTTGAIHVSTPAVSIGQPGMGGLAYQRSFDSSATDWRDNVTGTINSSGTTFTVTLMGQAEAFTFSAQGSVYTPTEGTGGRLTFAANVYTYTTASGVVALFDKTLASSQPTQANEGRVTQVTMPSGERLAFTYTELRTPAAPATPTFLAHRLQSLTDNLGYQLSFEYQTSTADATGLNLIKVTAINNAVEYCAPSANGCSLTQSWPYLSYAFEGTLAAPTARTVTDALGRATRYALSVGRVTGIRLPGSASNDVTVTYSGWRVTSVSSAAGMWIYTYTFSGPTEIQSVTIRDPLSHTRVHNLSDVGAFLGKRGASYFNGAFTTIFTRDTQGRLTRVTAPDGSATEYTYDLRGNTTQVKAIPTAGANIITTATYPASCGNPVTCNLPTSTTDARGFRTDYTYDPTHGGVLTVTAPAPTGAAPVGSGGVRPQTRYTYAQQTAQYIQAPGGSPTAAPTSVYRPTQTSSCATTASCAGGADETLATIGYGASGVANNRLPISVSSGAGNGSLTATTATTYDAVGNVLTTDGPLTGDTVRVRYDALRRRIGIVGPDPDGAGPLLHRAARHTYNTQGLVSTVEHGTVNSQSDYDWAKFASLEQLNVGYDAALRRSSVSFAAGGSTHAVTQYSYDAASRLDCVAGRMNPAVFSSLPASACTLGTEGANGPDRITRTTYDNANRPLTAISGLGTSAQQMTAANTYVTGSNQVATLTDANGNVTTYEYDGHHRLVKIRFPNASGGGSSLTDYEQYTYDAGSNVTLDRRRDGATIAFAYDNLSRATTMTPSSGAAVSYVYDNFSRLKQTASAGHTLSFAYDQISRNTSATGPLGTVSYEYDLAGRRTRMTWPDSIYVQYDYDLAGALTAIRENGVTIGAGVLASYAYDDRGRRTSVTRGNGVVTTYDFDGAGRLEELGHDLDSTGNDVAFNFAYNVAGQAISQNRTASNSAYVFAASPSVGSYANNGRNQVASLNGVNFSYDGRGNLTNTGAATYTYDIYNRLTGAGSATLAYDPVGRLYQTALGAVGTRFLYDGANMIAEYDDDSPTLLRRFVHGPGVDEPIVWYEGSGTTDRRWLVQDRLGSVIAVTDDEGAPISINSYDEYGLPSSSNAGRFQYTGQMWIAEAGLYHYKARAYAPSLGRFLQSDPILYAGGMNLYAYVGNDPLNGRDPSGLQDEEEEIIVTGIRPPREDYVVDISGMDQRTAGRLAELFRLLDKIDWDVFCARHDCTTEALDDLMEQALCASMDALMTPNSVVEGLLRGLPGNATYSRLTATAIVPAFGAGGSLSATRYSHEGGGSTFILAVSFNQGWAANLPTTIDEFGRRVLRGGGAASLTYGIANNPGSSAGVAGGASYRGFPVSGEVAWSGGSSWEAGAGPGVGAYLGVNFPNARTATIECPG